MGAMPEYVMSNAWEQERQRLAFLETLTDPTTLRMFETIGVARGWRCLEVGGGGGSIARWLCERVGPGGEVIATDIDTRFLEEVRAPNLRVIRHDAAEPLPEGGFDLVHARAVLMHLSARREILGRLAAALKPGGWLVVEDGDAFALSLAPPNAFRALMEKCIGAVGKLGVIDWSWGRALPIRMAELGLVEIAAELNARFFQGGSPAAQFWMLGVKQLAPAALAAGLGDEAEVDEALKCLADPKSWSCSPGHVSARGRRAH
jgi:SAM-dependent methyltransferase